MALGFGAFAAFLGLANAQSVSYTYESLGRLTSATYSDGRVIEYSYDPAGNRTEVVKTGVTNAAPDAVNDALADTARVNSTVAKRALRDAP